MSRRGWASLAIVAGLLAVAAGWYVASPWSTLKNMRDAARSRDSERLASYIDFPAVRESASDELAEQVDARLPGVLPRGLIKKLGKPVVDALVSPDVLSAALIAKPKGKGSGAEKCGLTREGLSEFRLRCAKLANGQADLIFRRRGLGWVLAGIDLPPDFKVKSLDF